MRLLTLALLTVPLAAQAPAGGQDWRFAHPSPAFLGSIHVSTVMHCSVIEAIWKQAADQVGSTVKPEQFARLRTFLNKVDEIYLSMRLDSTGRGDTLYLLTGRFEDDRAMQLLPTAPGDIWRRVDSSTVLLGQKEPVAQAVRRLAVRSGSAPNGAVLRQARALADSDIWITGTPVGVTGVVGLMRDLRSFSFGLNCQKGFRVDVAMDVVNSQVADRIVARSRPSPYVHIERLGPAAIRIAVSVPQSELTPELMQKLSGTLSGVAPPNAAPKSVTIYGLDDGTREVPLQKK